MLNKLLGFIIKRGEANLSSFELWADKISNDRFHKWGIVTLVFLLGLMTIGLIAVGRKPPSVIIVNQRSGVVELRESATSDIPAQDLEIRYFIENFVRTYLGINSQMVEQQMSDAMNMMTAQFQKVHEEDIKKDDIISKLVQANIKTNVDIKKIDYEDTGEYVFVSVVGLTELYSLSNIQSEPKRNGFKAILKLIRVNRSKEAILGLLVGELSNESIPIAEVENTKHTQNMPETMRGDEQ